MADIKPITEALTARTSRKTNTMIHPADFHPDTLRELNELSMRLLGHDLEALRFRCRGTQIESRLRGGDGKGWRPSGPESLALRVWLDAVLPTSRDEHERYEAPAPDWLTKAAA